MTAGKNFPSLSKRWFDSDGKPERSEQDMQEYDIIPYGNSEGIPIDRAGRAHRLINVTEMFKASGAPEHKKPYQWFNQEQTQELVEEISKVSEAPSITETRKGGTGGGGSTWYCEELALAYAMYLSPALHLACLRFILDSQPQPAAQGLSREDVRQMIQEEMRGRENPARQRRIPRTESYTLWAINRETLDALRELGGKATVKDIATHMGAEKKNTVCRRLRRLEGRGFVRRVLFGTYELEPDMIKYPNN
jgi:uncharacterized membrane protein